MGKSLVIVESPAKGKTINKYLGKDFVVEASFGHIMDLPKRDLGVELAKRTFEPTLMVTPDKEKIVRHLKKLAEKADAVYLAPDPDREGEAIAAHLSMQLMPVVKDKSRIRRVTFNEITQKAVRAAFEHPRDVDENLVDAQQTRRVLDRIVGYQISPLLWDKVRRGLSAGRVQTVAVRLIVEREREIQAFKAVEYWTIDAAVAPVPNGQESGQEFVARLVAIDGARAEVATVSTPSVPDQKTADAIVAAIAKARWSVKTVERKERRRTPAPPFTTSKLQQDASRQLGFSVKRTMGVAQRLYEGVDLGSEGSVGLITYMRTDSTRISPEAITAVRGFIGQKLGKQYLPEQPNAYRSKKDAQDAHEAIRPTNPELHPDEIRRYLSDEQYRLYKLIWQRFVASQMVPAVFDQTTVTIDARADRAYEFRATGSVLKFDGFLKVYQEASDTVDEDEEEMKHVLPSLDDGDALQLNRTIPEQHSTEPPPRYNEASLVKELEERGIGRPSTYASIITTIQDREYVTKMPPTGRGGRFYPTEIGTVVTDLLVANFPYIFDTRYTARLEEELDEIEDGKEKWTDLLKGFYGHFEEELKHAEKHMENVKRMEKPTDEKCDLCGSPLVLKWGKFGSFYACSAYAKEKPVAVAATAWKKEPKKVIAKVEGKLKYPMQVKTNDGDESSTVAEVKDKAELKAGIDEALGSGRKVTVEQVSCGFTKEHFEAKPDLQGGEGNGVQAEEYCEACGKVMVLRRGPFGAYMACPDYNADPPCKTVRRLSQKQQQKPAVPLDETCPKCGKQLVLRTGSYGEFVSCSGYPKCKYIKQNLIEGMKCPKCGEGDIAERKARTGNVFWGCTRYPKCDFTSNLKPVAQKCPQCGSPYVVERAVEGGLYLVCPNNKEMMPRRRPRKGKSAEVSENAIECHFSERIGDAPVAAVPTAATHGPVAEEQGIGSRE
ncbi:MAG TPA: type I DNA topoisomerase [Acidobacteriaceae bacterium]|jgi:DNA topoisomerase-1|nr:type I DNA topoisomerase [Acidobacteriaceae bacterium]